MNIGKNLQFLRRMHNGMTQEELAERMGVSRQTISKWELETVVPEMDKIIELCGLFGCTIDDFVQGDLCLSEEACSNIRVEIVEDLRYVRYAVISREPENDAINHVKILAEGCGDKKPKIIGWDFPMLSHEQINVYHMHGYEAAWILPEGMESQGIEEIIMEQKQQKYAAITIENPFEAPFRIIPNAYKILMAYMQINGLKHKQSKDIIECFEHSYFKNDTEFMDVFIAIE